MTKNALLFTVLASLIINNCYAAEKHTQLTQPQPVVLKKGLLTTIKSPTFVRFKTSNDRTHIKEFIPAEKSSLARLIAEQMVLFDADYNMTNIFESTFCPTVIKINKDNTLNPLGLFFFQ